MDYGSVEGAAAEVGFALRGGFVPEPEDGVPTDDAGRPAEAVVMLGFTPTIGWQEFAAARSSVGGSLPLDTYTTRVLAPLAQGLGARVLYPFQGPPWWPFQRWAMRSEAVHPSPLGLLVHPRHGLWHGYRGALLFPQAMPGLPSRGGGASPCEGCPGPCLSACPVGAYDGVSLDASRCREHLGGPEAEACFSSGCLARAACPVGSDRYPSPQRRFHLEAFFHAR